MVPNRSHFIKIKYFTSVSIKPKSILQNPINSPRLSLVRLCVRVRTPLFKSRMTRRGAVSRLNSVDYIETPSVKKLYGNLWCPTAME